LLLNHHKYESKHPRGKAISITKTVAGGHPNQGCIREATNGRKWNREGLPELVQHKTLPLQNVFVVVSPNEYDPE
jgi:hypothetical protein